MSMRLDDITGDPRIGGRIIRYHTYPRLREQTVAEHSWNVQRILLAIWHDCPRHMLVHCSTHDAGGELGPGDLPTLAKRDPELKRRADKLERDTHLNMCIPWYFPPPQELSVFEKAIFKLAEYFEAFELACQDYNMGDKNAELRITYHQKLIKDKCAEIEKIETVPKGVNVTTLLLRASNYYERRDQKECRISDDHRKPTGPLFKANGKGTK